MYWTAKRIKELKARGYRLRYMTLEEANAEVTSDKQQAPEATSYKQQATSLTIQNKGLYRIDGY